MKTPRLADSDERITEAGLENGSRLAPANTVLLLVRGSELNKRVPIGITTRALAFNQDVKALIPKTGIDANFLFYWLLAHRDLLLSKVEHTGIGAGKLDTQVMLRLPVEVPPFAEQQRIASFLKYLDDKIELNQRMNETLESIGQAIFRSWFVDFDPVRTKANGSNRPGIAADFPAEFSPSPIGFVPQGWAIGPITLRARLLSGGTPKTSRQDYWNGNIPWCSAKDVSQATETILLSTQRTITPKGLHESATQLIPPWCTVVVARGATTGRMVLLAGEMAMNQTCYALQSSIGAPLSLYCQLRVEIGNLVHAAHGSVFDTITTATFANSRVVIPPERLLLAFENEVKPLFDRILSNTKESSTLTALRETLLPRLVSGQVGFKQAEKIIEANA